MSASVLSGSGKGGIEGKITPIIHDTVSDTRFYSLRSLDLFQRLSPTLSPER